MAELPGRPRARDRRLRRTVDRARSGSSTPAIFDPATNTWTRVANMHFARWYPDLTELADGRYVAISGNTTDESHWADNPEVYDPTTNTWTVLSNVNTSQVHEQEYPFSYLVPERRRVHDRAVRGQVVPARRAEPDLDARWAARAGSRTAPRSCTGPGKILYSGGTSTQNPQLPGPRHHRGDRPERADADLAADRADELRARLPHADHAGRRHRACRRRRDDLGTDRPDTRSRAACCRARSGIPTPRRGLRPRRPATTRGYHSTAILMPDGTVLIGGSGHANPGYPAQTTSQIYSPPYLFKGARPTIASAPAAATLRLDDPGLHSRRRLDQRGQPGLARLRHPPVRHGPALRAAQLHPGPAGGSTYRSRPRPRPRLPGNYMLFILNSNGVPSVASFINIAPTAERASRSDRGHRDRRATAARPFPGQRRATAAARSRATR